MNTTERTPEETAAAHAEALADTEAKRDPAAILRDEFEYANDLQRQRHEEALADTASVAASRPRYGREV